MSLHAAASSEPAAAVRQGPEPPVRDAAVRPQGPQPVALALGAAAPGGPGPAAGAGNGAAPGRAPRPEQVLAMQRVQGNRAVQRMVGARQAAADGAGPAPGPHGPRTAAGGALDGATPLASLADAPASSFGAALAGARGAARSTQLRDKREAMDAIPAIDAPTGLPAVAAAPAAAPTKVAPPAASAAPAAARGAAPVLPPAPAARGPVPGSQVSTAAPEPQAQSQEDSGSWWDWLVGRLRSFFGSLPTHDANLSTSAGERERLHLAGDADPGRNELEVQAGDQSVEAGRGEADGATTADFGEGAVAPTLPARQLRPAYKPAAPKGGSGRGRPQQAPALPAAERATFDRETAPWVARQVGQQDAGYQREQAQYEQASRQAQEEGARQLSKENERTRTEQLALREAAQADVGGARERWREDNRKIQSEFGDKALNRRREVDRQVSEKVESTHREADTSLDEAERKAEAEKTRAEAEAAARKQAEEDKPRSWWDRVKGAVSDAFDAIRSAVTAIFDKLREVVKGLIDAARRAVHALIEAARSAIVGLIAAFGEFVKGLVSIALAAFPEAAARARAWIDGRVAAATDAVNRAAQVLQRAADIVLDGIAMAIDAALDVLQASLMAALDALEAMALLPFQAMEALAKLVEWVERNGKFVLAAMRTQTDGDTLIEALKNAVGGMVAEVPAMAHAKLAEFTATLGGDAGMAAPQAAPQAAPAAAGTTRVQRTPAPAAVPAASAGGRHVPASAHVAGVLRHLGKGLDHLKAHWWDELKKVGWNLLWPWPAVWQDLKDIWKEVKAGFDAAYHLQPGKVIDHILTADQKFNSILGNLYGWFFIASVLVGAVVGAFFGGAGAIPGALAGAAFAGEVGEALVVALVATESAVIVKSVADLAIGNDTAAEDEEDYGKIGGSTLTIAITLALMLLGEIAAKLAKSVWEGVVGLVRGERGPEVRVEVDGAPKADAPEARPEAPEASPDAPEARPDTPEPQAEGPEAEPRPDTPEAGADAPEVIDGERVVAEKPTGDGHEVKVTEEGRCLVCSTCEEIELRYEEQLTADTPDAEALRGELERVREMPNGDAKAEALAELERKLEALKAEQAKSGAAEPPSPAEMRMQALDQAARDASGALQELKDEVLRSPEVNDLRTDPAVKRDLARLEAEVDALGRERAGMQQKIDEAIEASRDPELADLAAEDAQALQQRLEEIRAEADRIRQEIDQRVQQRAEERAQAEAAERAAVEAAEEAQRRLENICDETDGTNRPDAVIGDGTTEAALLEEIQQGRPLGSPQGHHIKAAEAVTGLENALEDLQAARPQVQDPAIGAALDQTIARATERLARLRAAVEAWNRRAQTNPGVFNPDGSSRVQAGWP